MPPRYSGGRNVKKKKKNIKLEAPGPNSIKDEIKGRKTGLTKSQLIAEIKRLENLKLDFHYEAWEEEHARQIQHLEEWNREEDERTENLRLLEEEEKQGKALSEKPEFIETPEAWRKKQMRHEWERKMYEMARALGEVPGDETIHRAEDELADDTTAGWSWEDENDWQEVGMFGNGTAKRRSGEEKLTESFKDAFSDVPDWYAAETLRRLDDEYHHASSSLQPKQYQSQHQDARYDTEKEPPFIPTLGFLKVGRELRPIREADLPGLEALGYPTDKYKARLFYLEDYGDPLIPDEELNDIIDSYLNRCT